MVNRAGTGAVAPLETDEDARVAALRRLGVLDTRAEEAFDRVTRLARRLFDVPIALVSLVDANRQWFKSKQGLDLSETPREVSFCGHAIQDDGIMVIPDAQRDARFVDNPLVTSDPRIRFYAGCPLRAPGGHKVGTLCLIDRAPRKLTEEDQDLLWDLAQIVERNLAAIDLATTDELTGISNRRGFTMLAEKSLKACVRLERQITACVFDLDGFKAINDRWGHAVGDRALKDFAGCLRETFRESDVIGRLGGDDFGVVLSGAESTRLPPWMARLDERLSAHCRAANRSYTLRYNHGIHGCRPDSDLQLSELLRRADREMERAKARRRIPIESTTD